MNVHLRQCAYSSTCEYFGMITLNKSKEYNLLRTHAQKRQKSVKRKYYGKGGYYTLACDATCEVIEDLLNVPMRFIVWIFYSLISYDILEAN